MRHSIRGWAMGGLAAATMASCAGLSPSGEAMAQPMGKACQPAEYRQLDFWIGDWKAYQTASGEFDGDSKIESAYGGCVIRENWKDQNGMIGGSFSRYDRIAGHWRQTWVDSNGTQTDYVGAWLGDRMEAVARVVSAKDPAKVLLHKMTLTPRPDGTVRQYFEDSTDEGKTWKLVWDLIYRKS